MDQYTESLNKYGAVEYDGATLALTQEAYPSADASQTRGEDEWYEASAMDKDGNLYTVQWDVLDYSLESEEDTKCDWKVYRVIAR